MTKILVDKMPSKAEECPFAEYIEITNKHACAFKEGLYSRCKIEINKECDILKEYKIEEE